jgi:DNA-binding NarL/FixJ family response regulator
MFTIALVGHCGPDSFMLRSAVKYAAKVADVPLLVSQAQLDTALQSADAAHPYVLLVNRVLDGEFNLTEGVELIKQLKTQYPFTRCMLISNYPESQQAAVAVGGLPGFGKAEVGSAKMKEALTSATAGLL